MALTSRIRAYDPRWPAQFAAAAERLLPVLRPELVELHHVGSTAVPGLAAKPEIDMLAIVDIGAVPDSWSPALLDLGYRRGGDLAAGHHFFKRDVAGTRTHKLHLCRPEYPAVARMLQFRDHLRGHPDDRQRYETLKRRRERENTAGIREYLAAKAPFIQSVLDELDQRPTARGNWETGNE